MKTINILPSINNFSLSGRIINIDINEAKTRCLFSIIHNFGGDKEPSIIQFVFFSKDGKGFPECLQKGNMVLVNAAMKTNIYEKDGKRSYREDHIVKSVEEIPSANDIALAGRLAADAEISGKRAVLKVIRNFGGDNAPLTVRFVMFNKDGKFDRELLKKGTPVTVKAYLSSNNFVNEEGQKVYRNEYIVKSVTKAELVAKEVDDNVSTEEAEANSAEA